LAEAIDAAQPSSQVTSQAVALLARAGRAGFVLPFALASRGGNSHVLSAARAAASHDFAIGEDFMSENFETFLRFWIAENIRPLDARDSLDDMVRSRAKDLQAAATTAGFFGELDEAVHPYGSVEGFVRDKFKQAGKRA
jgi:hypothetical protein